MSSGFAAMIDLEAIRKPVRGGQPAGPDLTFDPTDRVYQQIRDAKPAEGGAEVLEGFGHLFDRQAAAADWPRVVRLGLDALYARTKDLQIAAWVVEALGNARGLAGLADGFALMRAIQEEFWDGAHPAIEDGDHEYRESPYLFLSEALPPLIREGIPLVGAGWPDATAGGLDRARAGGLDAWMLAARRVDAGRIAEAAGDLAACREAFGAWKADVDRRFPPRFPKAPAALGLIADALLAFDSAFLETFAGRIPPPRSAGVSEPLAASPVADEPSSPAPPSAAAPTAPAASPVAPASPLEQAEALAAAGKLAEATNILEAARQAAPSRRDRFLHQLRLAELFVDGARPAVAIPLLEELETIIKDRSLEEWEEANVCARVIDALIRALLASGGVDADRLREYYLRLCRLDPRLALRMDPSRFQRG